MSSSSASGAQHPPHASTPTQRKTVRFQTHAEDGDEQVLQQPSPRRNSGSGPPVAPVLRTNPFPDLPYFSFGSGLSNGRASASSSQPVSSSSSSQPVNTTTNSSSSSSSSSSQPVNTTTTTTNTTTTTTSPTYPKDDGKVVRPNLLQPRVAVVLGVPRIWHLPLFASRLLSVCPAIWWSLGILIRLVTQLHALAVTRGGGGPGGGPGAVHSDHDTAPAGGGAGLSLESRLKLTETALAMIWCGAAAYLSFFFTDCLMSRWLINYTPQATIVRLLAINALTGYLTSWVIYLMGSGGDSRLLLPAWVAIAAIMTGCYHATHNKINIRKETSISISVFSFASFISMAALLSQLYWDRPEYVDVPVVALTRRLCTETARIVSNVFDIGNITLVL